MDKKQRCCVICNHDIEEKVTLFTEATLVKCQDVLKQRIIHRLKYRNVNNLPSIPDKVNGYHVKCYKTFSALSKKYLGPVSLKKSKTSPKHEPEENISQDEPKLNKKPPLQVCVFCNKGRRKHNGKTLKLFMCNKSYFDKIKSFGNEMNIVNTLKDTISDEVPYHRICRLKFHNQLKASMNRKITAWHTTRLNHKEAYDELTAYIENEIIGNRNGIFSSLLYKMYKDILERVAGGNIDFEDINYQQYLEGKIKKTFHGRIKFIKLQNKKIIVSADINIDEVDLKTIEERNILSRAALILRNDLLKNLEKNELPTNLSTNDIMQGECSPTESLFNFFLTFIGGHDSGNRNNPHVLCKVNSLSEDAIEAVTNGQVITSKHMTLGLTLKNLTGNRMVLDILNKYGHCCNYNDIEAIESRLTDTAAEDFQALSSGDSNGMLHHILKLEEPDAAIPLITIKTEIEDEDTDGNIDNMSELEESSNLSGDMFAAAHKIKQEKLEESTDEVAEDSSVEASAEEN